MQTDFFRIEEQIFQIDSQQEFEKIALDIFKFQVAENPVYRKYVSQLNIQSEKISAIDQIPFLPVEFFRTEKIITENKEPQRIFTSSGTTGSEASKHFVSNLSIYEESFSKCFDLFYGKPGEYCILALLPSYLEREGSSLIYMMNDLIKKSGHKKSGFYLNNHAELSDTLQSLKESQQKTILLGVSFALLDFIEKYPIKFPELIVMETGGMKGRRKELIRDELHAVLCNGFGANKIHSEYGMTELLSQAYSNGNGIFKTPPWMKILIRDPNDPFNMLHHRETGGINIIDLANIYSCSFLATQDLGKTFDDNSFEVLGRFDLSDIRGCNLMVE